METAHYSLANRKVGVFPVQCNANYSELVCIKCGWPLLLDWQRDGKQSIGIEYLLPASLDRYLDRAHHVTASSSWLSHQQWTHASTCTVQVCSSAVHWLWQCTNRTDCVVIGNVRPINIACSCCGLAEIGTIAPSIHGEVLTIRRRTTKTATGTEDPFGQPPAPLTIPWVAASVCSHARIAATTLEPHTSRPATTVRLSCSPHKSSSPVNLGTNQSMETGTILSFRQEASTRKFRSSPTPSSNGNQMANWFRLKPLATIVVHSVYPHSTNFDTSWSRCTKIKHRTLLFVCSTCIAFNLTHTGMVCLPDHRTRNHKSTSFLIEHFKFAVESKCLVTSSHHAVHQYYR